MTRVLVAVLIALVSACSDPALNAGIVFGPGGVSIRPVISGNVGGANVAVSLP